MAFVDPIMIPKSKEGDWSTQIGEILFKQLETKQKIPRVSIYLVPEAIKKQKPEAYEPQQIGLGPNYHFKPWPYKKMEQRKLSSVRRVLEYCKIQNFTEQVLDKVKDLICDIRGCYDMFLQDDERLLAWILTLDGLFLLFLFRSYNSGDDSTSGDQGRYESNDDEHIISVELDTRREMFAQDLLMAENQIPFAVLKEIDMALNSWSSSSSSSSSGNSIRGSSEYNFSGNMIFRSFCETHTPFRLCPLAQAPSSVHHLLDYMYHSIVYNVDPSLNNNNRPQDLETSIVLSRIQHEVFNKVGLLLPIGNKDTTSPSLDKFPRPTLHFVHKLPLEKLTRLYNDNGLEDMEIGTSLIEAPALQSETVNDPQVTIDTSLFTKCSSPIVVFVQNIPWKKFIPLYEQTVTILETYSKKRSNIYSASELHRAGFKFHLLPREEGFLIIDSEGKDIYLPCVRLHTDSEVILRNLVVYETLVASSDDFPLTEYVGLMCGLIMNVNDVKLLKSKDIILGDLRDHEVAKIFTGLRSSLSVMKTSKMPKLKEAIVDVNTTYESRGWMSLLLLRKLAYWFLVVLKAIGMLAGASLKIVAFLISLIMVFLLTSQAYCDTYGCAKTNVSLLTYARFSQKA